MIFVYLRKGFLKIYQISLTRGLKKWYIQFVDTDVFLPRRPEDIFILGTMFAPFSCTPQ